MTVGSIFRFVCHLEWKPAAQYGRYTREGVASEQCAVKRSASVASVMKELTLLQRACGRDAPRACVQLGSSY